MIVPVPSVHAAGILLDPPPHRIPPGAWSNGLNARFLDGFAEGREGFGTLVAAPVKPVSLHAVPLGLVLAGTGSIYSIYSGATTLIGSGYTGGESDYWLGDVFNNWLCITNGVDVPQVLDTTIPSATMSPMPAWPSGYKVRSLRPYKNFLVGLGVSASGFTDMRRVKWSHPADPGTLPASWDHTDPAVDAGELTLGEGFDAIVDGIQFGDDMFILTANQTWVMRFVGGQTIFAFAKLANEIGLMAPGCMAVVPGVGLVAVTGSDVVVLPEGRSIADGAVRRTLMASIDPQFYHRTRLLVLPDDKELWLLAPEVGSSLLTLGMVWNWRLGVWSIVDIPQSRAVASRRGSIVYTVETIDSDTTVCDTADGVLCDDGPPAIRYTRQVWLGDDTTVHQLDPTVALPVMLEREGFAFLGPEQVDEYTVKRAVALRPDVTGPAGATLQVTVGWQLSRSSAMQWGDPITFTIGTSEEVQFSAVGRFFGFRFAWSDPSVRLYGYTVELHSLGQAL